jgi:DNA-binding winged helix-turn-helix (wHTH) protein
MSDFVGNNDFENTLSNLTRTQQRLLIALANEREKSLSKPNLALRVWGDNIGRKSAINVIISSIRKRLRDCNSNFEIETVHGWGFRLKLK